MGGTWSIASGGGRRALMECRQEGDAMGQESRASCGHRHPSRGILLIVCAAAFLAATDHGWGSEAQVEDAGEMLKNLETTITKAALPRGTTQDLVATVHTASAAFERANYTVVEGTMGAFVNKVEAQQGKTIGDQLAHTMVGIAERVLEMLYARGLMRYYSFSDAEAELMDLDSSEHARVEIIGYGYDYSDDVSTPPAFPVYAIRVSADTDSSIEDNPDKNSILFECGMHGREWLPIQSCMELARHLVNNAEEGTTAVPELLAHVDVWIVPMSNPAGRNKDSEAGDPRSFNISLDSGGWRGNADTRLCEYGVDVARNFSVDFVRAEDACGLQYRGLAPFSTDEANNLRQFVENHTISMAVVLHSTSQQIWNLWGDTDAAGRYMAEQARLIWQDGWSDPVAGAMYELVIEQIGGNKGQFTAWLAHESRDSGLDETDEGTLRAIQTIYIELPFDNFHRSNYYGGPYQYGNSDGSNSFHPSSAAVEEVIADSFIPMAEYLIRQSRSPRCPTSASGLPVGSRCTRGIRRRDFGIVGAKVTVAGMESEAGELVSFKADWGPGPPRPAQVYLMAGGDYSLPYRVQNFTTRTRDVDVRLTVRRQPGCDDPWSCPEEVLTYDDHHADLATREARSGVFSLEDLERCSEYQLELEVREPLDNFSANDKKIFRFVIPCIFPDEHAR